MIFRTKPDSQQHLCRTAWFKPYFRFAGELICRPKPVSQAAAKRFMIPVVFFMLTLASAECIHAEALRFSFADLTGDDDIAILDEGIDVVSMEVLFDNETGAYTVTLNSTNRHPFQGKFRVNLNLLNKDAESSKSFFQDTVNDFVLNEPTMTLTLTGSNPALRVGK